MSDPSGSDPSGAGAEAREIAERLAQEIAPMVKQARLAGFDFLAYLLGMALKESRRLAQGDNES
jgi:8-oxo-dGTP diphosphatase